MNTLKNITLQINLEGLMTIKDQAAMFSENELIQGCVLGKKEYQEALYKKYAKVIYGICLRYVKGNAEAQDLMHDCFIKVFINIKNFRHESALKTWISKIAVNEALQYLKKELKLHFETDVYQVNVPDEEIMDELIDKIELTTDEILSAIQKLPVGYKTVLNFYAIENYSHSEIAEKLCISINTSKTQLHKARKYLNELLKSNKRS